ncbi:MAG: hypothetical protein BWX86_00399 [Verrucomicrobia bacterium ADurb.Bin122]|nr:MAG: hypothetical protein BWX86_00399 [Verrucomicrobia bacterium ADurb.Bin122]
MCCTQAKLALLFGGTPYTQRGSPSSRPSHHSLMLKGGLAITKSARRSGCWSLRKESAGCLPKLKSMPRMAMFIAARRQVVGLLSWPYTEIAPSLPPWASMKASLCTKKPPEPMAGSYTLPE